MAKLLEEWKEDLVEALTERDLLLGSKHRRSSMRCCSCGTLR